MLYEVITVIMFTPLSEKEIEEIVKLQFEGFRKRLESSGIRLELSSYNFV